MWLRSGDEKKRGFLDLCLVGGSKEEVVGATKGLREDGLTNRTLLVEVTQRGWDSKNGLIFFRASRSQWGQMGSNGHTYRSITPSTVSLSV